MNATTVPNTHGVGRQASQDGTVQCSVACARASLHGLVRLACLDPSLPSSPFDEARSARSLPHATEFGDEAAARRVRVWYLLRRRAHW